MAIIVAPNGNAAVSTYAELIEAVERSMDREYSGEVDSYIRLTEARFNRRLRGPDMEKIATLTLANGAVPYPADFLEAKRVTYDGETLDFIASTELANMRAANYPNINHFSIIGSEIVVPPVTTGSITLLYWGAINPLGDSYPTNWLLTRHPDLYFAGVMHEACADIKDQDAILWLQKFEGLLEEVKSYLVSKQIAGPMRMTPQIQPWNARI